MIYAGAGILASLLGAVVGAWLSGKAARDLDDLARRRDQERARAKIRAAAAFIRADLDTSRRRLREAMEDDEWHVFYRLPTAAWREHGPTIATSLQPDDVARIAHSFARLEDFERALSVLPVRRFGIVTEGAPRPLRFNEEMREKVKEIAGLTGQRSGCWRRSLLIASNHPRRCLASGRFGRPRLCHLYKAMIAGGYQTGTNLSETRPNSDQLEPLEQAKNQPDQPAPENS
ncbi:MAG TPA: hypothetical protein VFX44_10745 [Solirubrobacterales bacterium]|nr:hypothetical protein [Solirubrobacterales bacterium]